METLKQNIYVQWFQIDHMKPSLLLMYKTLIFQSLCRTENEQVVSIVSKTTEGFLYIPNIDIYL